MMIEFDNSDDYEGGSVDSSHLSSDYFWTVDKALVVLRFEAELRTGKDY